MVFFFSPTYVNTFRYLKKKLQVVNYHTVRVDCVLAFATHLHISKEKKTTSLGRRWAFQKFNRPDKFAFRLGT